MFSPDREPHPAVAEAKFLMQPVVFSSADGSSKSPLRITASNPSVELMVSNRYTFLDLSHLLWDFEIKSSLSPDAHFSGAFDVNGDRCILKLDRAVSKLREIEANRPLGGNSYFLNIRGVLREDATWADKGHVVVSQQFPLELVGAPTPVVATPTARSMYALTVSSADSQLRVWRKNLGEDESQKPLLLVTVDRSSGSLAYYAPHGTNLFVEGCHPNFTRATTDNDRGGLELALNFLFPFLDVKGLHGLIHGNQDYSYWSRWKSVGLAAESPPITTCILSEVTFVDATKVDLDVISKVTSREGQRLLFTVSTHYTVYQDGSVRLATNVIPSRVLRHVPSLPRVGLHLQLMPELFRIQYFGRGPGEVSNRLFRDILFFIFALFLTVRRRQNYPDRKTGSQLGLYETTPSRMGFTYIVPSENGSRSDCKWVAFRDETGFGVCVTTERSEGFSCSALLYSASELNSATHTCDLENRADGKHPIHCSIDHKLMGLGGDTRYASALADRREVEYRSSIARLV
jgi:beta-galactosidase